MLTRVSLAPFLPGFPIEAWEALGSWEPRNTPDELIIFCTFTVASVTCNVRDRQGLLFSTEMNILLGFSGDRSPRWEGAGPGGCTPHLCVRVRAGGHGCPIT